MIIIPSVKLSQTSLNLPLRPHEDSHGPTLSIVGSDPLTGSGGGVIVLLVTKGVGVGGHHGHRARTVPTPQLQDSSGSLASFRVLMSGGRVTAAKLLSRFCLSQQHCPRRFHHNWPANTHHVNTSHRSESSVLLVHNPFSNNKDTILLTSGQTLSNCHFVC